MELNDPECTHSPGVYKSESARIICELLTQGSARKVQPTSRKRHTKTTQSRFMRGRRRSGDVDLLTPNTTHQAANPPSGYSSTPTPPMGIAGLVSGSLFSFSDRRSSGNFAVTDSAEVNPCSLDSEAVSAVFGVYIGLCWGAISFRVRGWA